MFNHCDRTYAVCVLRTQLRVTICHLPVNSNMATATCPHHIRLSSRLVTVTMYSYTGIRDNPAEQKDIFKIDLCLFDFCLVLISHVNIGLLPYILRTRVNYCMFVFNLNRFSCIDALLNYKFTNELFM